MTYSILLPANNGVPILNVRAHPLVRGALRSLQPVPNSMPLKGEAVNIPLIVDVECYVLTVITDPALCKVGNEWWLLNLILLSLSPVLCSKHLQCKLVIVDIPTLIESL